jgi:hypothetical protein
MHDINRTQLETGWETGLSGEAGYESYAYEEEMYPEYGEAFETYESSYGETGPLGEAEEMELAAELLGVSNEQELDQFIGKIFNKVKNAVGSFIPPEVRKSLGGLAKGLAKKVLPVAGAALGNLVVPGLGGMVGGQVANMAGQAFGLELEGLSAEDQEFEIARRYTRLISDAAQEAANIPPTVPPQAAAQQALSTSAEKHAPGLVAAPSGQSPMQAQRRQSQQANANGRHGRWVRRGRVLIIYGV